MMIRLTIAMLLLGLLGGCGLKGNLYLPPAPPPPATNPTAAPPAAPAPPANTAPAKGSEALPAANKANPTP